MTNYDNLVYCKVQWTVALTEILTDFLQSVTRFKLRQVLHSAMDLLQIAKGITKCKDY